MNDVVQEYRRRFDTHLSDTAGQLERLIRDHLTGTPHIDRISARAKDPERFAGKAEAMLDDGSPKYANPLQEVQDQIGARIVVLYLQDVDVVAEQLCRYFQPIEKQHLVPESEWSFGYFGQHFVFAVPRDVVPSRFDSETPPFFELQIKTLFQHAWSEANHDLGYKAVRELTPNHTRCLAYAAAQAWGADRMFGELSNELLNN